MTDTDLESSEDARMQQMLRVYAKRELRTRMTSVRNVLPESACTERSGKACDRVLALPEFAAAKNVAGYVAMRKELDTRAVLDRAAELGKVVLLPRVEINEAEETGLAFHVYTPGDPLEESGWGVLEPAPGTARVAIEDIELMLVPALALDLRGFRIGYGKSFYDRVLPHLTRGRSIGLAYDFQLLAEVPNEPHDMRVHMIVTDARTEAAQSPEPTSSGA